MKRIPAIFFCFLLASILQAQQQVRGRVTDAATGQPLTGCSVYISGSSIGTSSAADGSFQLKGIPLGKNQLVVSSIGYALFTQTLPDNQTEVVLNITLSLKAKELENVVAETYVTEGWEQWGKLFLDNFLGTMPQADRCRIQNTNAIRFRFYRKSNRVRAIASAPLWIVNDLTGYRIRYEMEDFEVNFKTGMVYFQGYSLFEETGGKGEKAISRKENNREEAYVGSVMHFMRALYDNRLKEEGFEVRRLWKMPNLEKERIKALYRQSMQVGSNGTVQLRIGSGSSADSSNYYRRVLMQPDQIERVGDSLLSTDSLLLQSGDGWKEIWFDQYLEVIYKGGLEDPAYLIDMRESRSRGFRRSLVQLVSGNSIIVNGYGNFYHSQDLLNYGYWAWSEKMANNLPLDYRRAADKTFPDGANNHQ